VVHLVGQNNHHLSEVARSAACSDVQRHTHSATHKGSKKTICTYEGCIKRFCAWGNDFMEGTLGLMPLSRHVVFQFLGEGAKRRLPLPKRRPLRPRADKTGGDRLPAPRGRVRRDHSEEDSGSDRSGNGSDTSEEDCPERPAAPKCQRRAAGTPPSAPGRRPTSAANHLPRQPAGFWGASAIPLHSVKILGALATGPYRRSGRRLHLPIRPRRPLPATP